MFLVYCQGSIKRTTRASLVLILSILCSSCVLLGNNCGNRSHSEQQLDNSENIRSNQIAPQQDDGTFLVPAIDCTEACERFGARATELLELDSCELSLHPVLEDPSRFDDFGNARDWTRADAIEEPITLPAEWNPGQTVLIAHCDGLYRTECQH